VSATDFSTAIARSAESTGTAPERLLPPDQKSAAPAETPEAPTTEGTAPSVASPEPREQNGAGPSAASGVAVSGSPVSAVDPGTEMLRDAVVAPTQQPGEEAAVGAAASLAPAASAAPA